MRHHLSWRTTYSWQKVPHFNVIEPVTKDLLYWEATFFMAKGVVFQNRFYCIWQENFLKTSKILIQKNLYNLASNMSNKIRSVSLSVSSRRHVHVSFVYVCAIITQVYVKHMLILSIWNGKRQRYKLIIDSPYGVCNTSSLFIVYSFCSPG